MKKCLHCGAEMPDEERFCSECGAEFAPEADMHEVLPVEPVEIPVEETVAGDATEIKLEEVLDGAEAEIKPVAPVPEKPAKKKKIKWWHIAIPAVLVVAIVAVLVLGPLFIYLSPKTVLAKAFGETVKDLSARAEGTPLTVMSKAYDEGRKNTVKVEYDIFQEMLGDMSIEVEAKVDSSINQSQIGIQLGMMGQEVDMNLYMDREVAAVNMDMLTGDDYYGIYYDTFGEDIRNNEFMYDSLGEENIEMYEEAVEMIGQLMNLETITPEQQAESLKKYGEVILSFAEEKDVQVGKAEIFVDGKAKNCKTVSFTITTEEYADLMLQIVDIAETDPVMLYYYKSMFMDFEAEYWKDALDELRAELEDYEDEDEGVCVFTFCLHGGKVVQVGMAYQVSDDSGSLVVNFGSDAAVEDIVISGEFVEDEDENSFEVTLSTEKDGDVIAETLYIVTQEDDEDPYELELGYEWNRKSGDLCLYFEDEMSGELGCVLEELENGYRFSIPAVEDLIESMGEDTGGIEMSIDISVTTGAEIEVPETIKDIAKLTELDMMSIASILWDV